MRLPVDVIIPEAKEMGITLYQEISLRRDFPEYAMRAGDVATVVDFVPHPEGGEQGCVLEVFNAVGESLEVVAVPISAVTLLRSDEVLMIRSREIAARLA